MPIDCHAKACEARRGMAIKLISMKYSFFSIWALLNPQGEYKRRRRGCERLWAGYDEAIRQHVYDTINEARQQGLWINPNPYFAIEDIVLAMQHKPRSQTLSYAEYYARYHTTEPRDGWQMANPTGNKVIYVKQIN